MALNLEDTTELVLAANAGTVNLAAFGGKGPTGPAGADGGSDVSYAGFVSDTTPSLTRSAILAIGGTVDGLASLDGDGKVPATELPSGAAGGVAYGDGTDLAFTGAGTSGQVLTSNGAGAPSWEDAASGGSTTWPTALGRATRTTSTTISSTDTSNTGTAISTTTLRVTFTVPASGNVRVMAFGGNISNATNSVYIGVKQGATPVAGSWREFFVGSTSMPLDYRSRITGLTAGASLTWDLGWYSSGGTRQLSGMGTGGDGSFANPTGPVIFEVYAE